MALPSVRITNVLVKQLSSRASKIAHDIYEVLPRDVGAYRGWTAERWSPARFFHTTFVSAVRPKMYSSNLEKELVDLRRETRAKDTDNDRLISALDKEIKAMTRIHRFQLGEKNTQILFLSRALHIRGVIDHLEDDWVQEYEMTKKLPKGLHPKLMWRKHLERENAYRKPSPFDKHAELWKLLKEHDYFKEQLLEVANDEGKKLISVDIFNRLENLVENIYRKAADQAHNVCSTGDRVCIDSDLLSPDEIVVVQALCRLFEVEFEIYKGSLRPVYSHEINFSI
ncbi:uncharacterized protein LOC129598633 [Paramacrobiotus metropolitanus]|uniref:uncharacterized protein LOC129598633 n=1 Tax=Paramacrobiotus metropolitanus TaxID=2943436 RepID=UPI0024464EC8|nr:uncharacterized protein LOC129598633 [Paramacrobiotus metropolitanus]XP_055352611.1 uncharacterized protein LOC129598633 [Paramacrobiotus metropolitanus]